MSDSHSPVPAASHAPDDHGHGHEDHDFWGHCKLYVYIGILLGVLTAVTVGLSYVDFARIGITRWIFGLIGISGNHINIVVGMIVATFKVCLVGAIFMHLKGEKKTIWQPLYFTAFFVLGLFLLTLLHWYDPIFSTVHAHH